MHFDWSSFLSMVFQSIHLGIYIPFTLGHVLVKTKETPILNTLHCFVHVLYTFFHGAFFWGLSMSCLCKYRESLSKSGGVCVLREGSVSVQGLSFPTKAYHTGERSLGKGNRKLSWQGRAGSGPCFFSPGLGLAFSTKMGTVLSKVYMLPRFQLQEAQYFDSCLTCLWAGMGVHTSVCSFNGLEASMGHLLFIKGSALCWWGYCRGHRLVVMD